jgi:hypothetical protein
MWEQPIRAILSKLMVRMLYQLIPSFIKLGVPDLVLSINMADEGRLCLSDQSSGGSAQEMGTLSLNNLAVGLTFPAGSALYIYAH